MRVGQAKLLRELEERTNKPTPRDTLGDLVCCLCLEQALNSAPEHVPAILSGCTHTGA